jgi:hypothetical protein
MSLDFVVKPALGRFFDKSPFHILAIPRKAGRRVSQSEGAAHRRPRMESGSDVRLGPGFRAGLVIPDSGETPNVAFEKKSPAESSSRILFNSGFGHNLSVLTVFDRGA